MTKLYYTYFKKNKYNFFKAAIYNKLLVKSS